VRANGAVHIIWGLAGVHARARRLFVDMCVCLSADWRSHFAAWYKSIVRQWVSCDAEA